MSLTYAIDELYESGWEPADAGTCERSTDGRLYPVVDAVERAFRENGSPVRLQVDEQVGVFIASWGDSEGVSGGAVVGGSRDEAAVFAMARLLGMRGAVAAG